MNVNFDNYGYDGAWFGRKKDGFNRWYFDKDVKYRKPLLKKSIKVFRIFL